MDWVTHGVLGGSLYAIPVRLATQSDLWASVAFAYGFIEGSSPDTFDWIAAKVSKIPRWVLYGIMHERRLSKVWQFLPALFLHVQIVDPPFHAAGEHWWPREWPRAVAWWAVALVGLFLTFG